MVSSVASVSRVENSCFVCSSHRRARFGGCMRAFYAEWQAGNLPHGKMARVSLLINTKAVAKAYGVTSLFANLSLSFEVGDRLGVIGPNGSGKSTLLEILAGRVEPDSGEVVRRSGTRLAYVPQDSQFTPGETVRSVIARAMDRARVPDTDRTARAAETLGRAGFEDFDGEAAALSGGWRKRLSIVEALVQTPAILLLDEPTNHLDLAGIQWL